MPRPQPDAFLAGRNPVREALQSGSQIEKVLLQDGASGRSASEIRAAARSAGVPVQTVPKVRLDRHAPGVNHQGVVALMAAVEYADFDDMLRAAAADLDTVRALKPVVVLLDEIQDPHNLGAILRSAVAAGAAGVVLPERNSAPVNPAAVKASAGTARQIPVARVTNLRTAIVQLKERGYWVVGTAADGEQTIWDMDWDRPLALVIGNEDKGIRPAVAADCDFLVRIPMRGAAESLNASVAAGLVLFTAVRGRQ